MAYTSEKFMIVHICKAVGTFSRQARHEMDAELIFILLLMLGLSCSVFSYGFAADNMSAWLGAAFGAVAVPFMIAASWLIRVAVDVTLDLVYAWMYR